MRLAALNLDVRAKELIAVIRLRALRVTVAKVPKAAAYLVNSRASR